MVNFMGVRIGQLLRLWKELLYVRLVECDQYFMMITVDDLIYASCSQIFGLWELLRLNLPKLPRL
jgi:hypothetical protein